MHGQLNRYAPTWQRNTVALGRYCYIFLYNGLCIIKLIYHDISAKIYAVQHTRQRPGLMHSLTSWSYASTSETLDFAWLHSHAMRFATGGQSAASRNKIEPE